MARPERSPALLPALLGAVSARVQKRVQDDPALAERWMWAEEAGVTTVAADDVVVRIVGPLATDETLTCTCLIAPKCLHRLAVATVLQDASTAPAAPTEQGPAAAPQPERIALSAESVALAGETWRALASLLRLGAHRADGLVRAGLGRAAWEARAVGLPRLGRSITRVVQSLRLYEAGHPTFALGVLAADLADALWVARSLPEAATAEHVGEARRTYAPVGALRLWGLVSEPVIAAGSAGVVTHFADARGRLWEVSDVRPRAPGQAAGTYDVAPPFSVLSHRRLAREGLFVQGATAAGSRLGAGEGVHAVRAAGATGTSEPLDALWARGEVGGLRFVEGCVAGLWRDALLLETASGAIAIVPGSEHASLPWRDNLKLLARAPGLALRLVGREVPGRPRTLVGLGIAGASLALPGDQAGRVCLGLDRLTTAHVPVSAARPAQAAPQGAVEREDPFAQTRRRVERMVLGGAASIPGEAMGHIEREVARLAAAAAPSAAALLDTLARRTVAARHPGEAAESNLAMSWLVSARFLTATDAERARRAWG